MDFKTNVMRLLDGQKIKYKSYSYDQSIVNGVEVAGTLGQNQKQVFKTLVTIAKSREYYVFVIPVAEELDLKKAAQCVGEKAIEMIKSKELLPITGYIHGGCSPIGMKKRFVTTFDISAKDFPTVIFSAGKVGYQVEMILADLQKMIEVRFAELV